MNILIIGDSFATKYNGAYLGWSEMLEKYHIVTNLAQAGISEYKILKQLQSATIKDFDCVIVSHTSPYRIHTAYNPLHTSGFHKDCDFIYEDVRNRLPDVEKFFTDYFDLDYANYIYELIRKEITSLLTGARVIDTDQLDLKKLFLTDRGDIQHLSKQGNIIFYNRLEKHLETKNES
tara:strand:- start:35 stop:565 length:531 start_codon:yes stop_codon:yes gene_type:complete